MSLLRLCLSGMVPLVFPPWRALQLDFNALSSALSCTQLKETWEIQTKVSAPKTLALCFAPLEAAQRIQLHQQNDLKVKRGRSRSLHLPLLLTEMHQERRQERKHLEHQRVRNYLIGTSGDAFLAPRKHKTHRNIKCLESVD